MNRFKLWNTHKLYARRRPDGAGNDYNPQPLWADIQYVCVVKTVFKIFREDKALLATYILLQFRLKYFL